MTRLTRPLACSEHATLSLGNLRQCARTSTGFAKTLCCHSLKRGILLRGRMGTIAMPYISQNEAALIPKSLINPRVVMPEFGRAYRAPTILTTAPSTRAGQKQLNPHEVGRVQLVTTSSRLGRMRPTTMRELGQWKWNRLGSGNTNPQKTPINGPLPPWLPDLVTD